MANVNVQMAEPLVTACGRRIDVGRLKVDGPSGPIGRVLDDQPARITSLRLVLALPPGLDPQRHAALRDALTRCAVTNTLRHPPKVMVVLR